MHVLQTRATGDMIVIHTCMEMHAIQKGDPFGGNTKPAQGSFNKLQSSTSAQSHV